MKGSIRLRNEKYSYYFKYKDEYGKWKTKEKGGFATKKEAESAMRKAIVNFEETSYIEKATNYTLSDYINYWFEHQATLKLRRKTIRLYTNITNKHIVPKIGHLSLTSITPRVLQNFFTEKQKTLGVSAINAIKNVLSNTFKLAIEQRLVRWNPVANIITKSSSPKRKELDFLTRESIDLILNKVVDTIYEAPFMIAIHTGMRRGEILGLWWEDIDFDQNTITITKQLQIHDKGVLELVPTKTRTSERAIQMTKSLNQYLVSLKQKAENRKIFYHKYYHQEYFFVCSYDDGRPIKPPTLTQKAKRLSNELDILFKFHDLRHAHATMMLEADVNIKILQGRLGHAKITQTLDTYSHVTKVMEDRALEKFNNFF